MCKPAKSISKARWPPFVKLLHVTENRSIASLWEREIRATIENDRDGGFNSLRWRHESFNRVARFLSSFCFGRCVAASCTCSFQFYFFFASDNVSRPLHLSLVVFCFWCVSLFHFFRRSLRPEMRLQNLTEEMSGRKQTAALWSRLCLFSHNQESSLCDLWGYCVLSDN